MPQFLETLFSTNGLLIGTLLPFLAVLTIVVFVHEMGHYLVGRWCGIGVKAFSVGLGPELFGFTDKHGTRWKFSAVPLGGYVKFLGDMNATSTPDSGELEKLTEAEKRVAFHTQPVWKRAATVVAGPLFNFLLTIAVFTVLLLAYGKVVVEPMVASVQPNSPAAEAGFMPGDRFVSVDGSTVSSFDQVQRIVQRRAGDPIVFVLRRGDTEVSLTATPEIREIKDPLGNTMKVGIIGVQNDEKLGQPRNVTYTPLTALQESVRDTGAIVVMTGQFLKRLVTGREDRCQLGGPVKIAKMSGQAAALGIEWLIQLAALLSVGIGILNLLPIPPLDGGHLAFYAIEAAMRRPVSERAMDLVYRVGFFAVLTFMVFVFWQDIFGC